MHMNESSKHISREKITINGKKYTLSLSDDFNFLNRNIWAYCPQQERQDAGGVWRRSCSETKDGQLIITCDIAEDGTPISGGIRSTKKYRQAYGLYNMRFKMEKADGLWYAFWLYTDKMNNSAIGHDATDGAELDIIELVPHTTTISAPDVRKYSLHCYTGFLLR